MTDPNTPVPVALITITAHDQATTDTIKLQTADAADDISLRILYALAICEHVPTETLAKLATNQTTLIKMRDDAAAIIDQLERTEAALNLMVSIAQSGDLQDWEQFRQGVVKGAQYATTPTN